LRAKGALPLAQKLQGHKIPLPLSKNKVEGENLMNENNY